MTQAFGAVIKEMCESSLALQCSVVFSTGNSFQLQLTVIILLVLLKDPKSKPLSSFFFQTP